MTKIVDTRITWTISAPVLAVIVLIAGCLSVSVFAADKPKLVLQITVDQLRGDLPTRYYDRLGEGGFRYLWENGLVYGNAHHAHANTETIVGHATLATGTHPSIHGMIGNIWFDRETGYTTYNIEDPDYRLLTEGADVDEDAEIDPTQKAARSEGRSPASILVTTFSDELRSANGGQSKVFGVSVKDRGAISLAGHSGKAFWFSKASGQFVTSNYYYDEYPQWVKDWNDLNIPQNYAESTWALLNESSSYIFADTDDRPWELDLGGFGRTFPHAYGKGDGKYYTTMLTASPAGDAITLDFAKALVEAEQLGQDEVTDYLSISFSSTDYVGHLFGPSSLEGEDNILRLDRTLAELLRFIDEKVGMGNTLVVLSADHGGPDSPGYLNSLGIPAGYVEPDSWDTAPAIERLKNEFGIEGKIMETYNHPYLFFSEEVTNNGSIDKAALEQAVARELATFPGVSIAVGSSALREGNVPDTALHRAVLNNFHPKRSGDIYVVFEPNWFINDFDGLMVAVTHGSPWPYDTWVPVVFAGAGVQPGKVVRKIHTVDIAPTLSAYLGAKPPSGSAGTVLQEVFR
ncbi:MAG: alkaline phosphatase family protein [Arenicellales bacterium]